LPAVPAQVADDFRGEAEAALSRPVAGEVGQSTNAIIAEAEAAGRAALAAVGDSHRGAAAGTAWLTAAWAAAALTGLGRRRARGGALRIVAWPSPPLLSPWLPPWWLRSR